MAKQTLNNIKLGAFVMGAMLFLVLLLYMIGKNRNLFGSTYVLKARFENVQGLVAGNNVRFSGINAGTVKRVKILSDTVIEVTMIIEKRMKTIIRKDAIVSIGTDGLVGNKVINIIPSGKPTALAEEYDILVTKKGVNTDEMLQTLYKTNNDLSVIAGELKQTIMRINNSSALWKILNDQTLPADLKLSLSNIREASRKANSIVDNLDLIVLNIKNGKGSVGALLTDTSFAIHLDEAILKIKNAGTAADSLAGELREFVDGFSNEINNGKGAIQTLLKDSSLAANLRISLNNIEKGTEGFNQNMEALKHNIFFRGYFRKLEKQNRKN